MPEHLSVSSAPAPVGPYSPVVKANGFVFLSGQVPLTADGPRVDADVATQTEIVCHNITAILDELGLGWPDVAKATIFMTDIADYPTINEVYAVAVGSPAPARSAVQVAALPLGAKVEIEVVAVDR
ncbi:MAG: Rid family detoxifying hydrolase [Acidimicrobiia bacterium]